MTEILDLDYLGAAHPGFPSKLARQITSKEAGIGMFYDEFGDGLMELKEWIDDGFSRFRMNGYWGGSQHLWLLLLTQKLLLVRCRR